MRRKARVEFPGPLYHLLDVHEICRDSKTDPNCFPMVYSVPYTVLRGSKRYFMALAYKPGMTDSVVESYSIDYGADAPVMEVATVRPRLANNGD
jgi:hypothetical protein